MTENNWFTTNLTNRTCDNLCDFQIKMDFYEFKKTPFTVQSAITAHKISEQYSKLFLAYSGGLDSEYVLKVFHEQNLPITPLILNTPYNKLDYLNAISFCEKYNITPQIISYNENEIIDLLKSKTTDRGFFSLLGGVPLILADIANQQNGKLITGYGDPFDVIAGLSNNIMSSTLAFSEWDYYLDSYDNSHPSGFYTYDISLLYSLINDIEYSGYLQQAKSKLYGLEYRKKISWDEDFYHIFRELKPNVKKFSLKTKKVHLLSTMTTINKGI